MASNVEDILKATIDGKIYGGNIESRVEELLVELKDKIDEGGGGGGGDLNMHGSGRANSLVYIEDISEITSDMYDSIDNGSFDLVHAGMHYTAPSGRDYYMADANYFLGHGDTEIVKIICS